MMERAFRWRVAGIGSGLVLAILMWAGGLFAAKKAIIIEYGMLGDDALGAEVYIDDELAGRLEALTRATRTGFEVSEGAHVVRIEHPELGCEPIRIETQQSSSAVYLLIDVMDFYDDKTGRTESRIVFN